VAVTATYTASTTAGFCTITATEALTGGSGKTSIDQETSPALTAATVTPTPATATIAYGGTQVISFSVGNPGLFVGDQVNFTVAPGTAGDTVGTLSAASGVTAANGTVSVTYTAPSGTTPTAISPTAIVTATEADTAAHGASTITEGTAASIVASLSSTATFTGANGTELEYNLPINTSGTINLSVTNVTNAADNGGSVTFAYVGSSTGCPTIPAATTLAVPVASTTGTATATFTANANVGTSCELDAVVDSNVPALIATSNPITFDEIA
jgi:hypothetical protein